MPRVPQLSGPSLEPRAAPSSAPNLLSGTSALGTAVQQVGGAIEQQAGKVEQKFQKEAREAEAVIGADADLELDSRLEAVKTETFKLKGLSASEGRAKAVEQAAKSRAEVAAAIKSEAERNRFLVRSATAVMAARRQIEHYVGSEFEAHRQGVLKATEDSAVSKAQSGVLDPAEFSLVETNAIRTIRETQRSEEEGTARIADLQSRTAAGYTQGLLAQGRVADAVQYVEKSRATLGTRYPEAKALVDRANAGAEKDRIAGEVAKLVDTSAEAVRTPDGYVTEEELRKAVPVEGYEGQQRDQVEAKLRQRLQLERAKLKADGDKHRDNVNRADLQGGRAGESEVWLEKYDPDFLLRRQSQKRAEYRAWKASQGDAKSKAAEARLQKAVDQEFLNRLNAELINDPTTKPDDFLTTFIAEKAKQGDDVTVSDVAKARAGLDAAKAGKRAESAEGVTERAVASRFERTLGAAFKQKGKPLDQKLLNERVGRALGLYRERLEAKGKPLDEAELAGLEAEMLREVTVSEPGRFWGTNDVKKKAIDVLVTGTEPSRPMPAGGVRLDAWPTASGKNGERYRLSDDGKSWEIIK